MGLFDRLLGLGRRKAGPDPVEWPGYGMFHWPFPAGNYPSYRPVTVQWLGELLDFIPDPKTAEGVVAALPTADALVAEPQRWKTEVETVALRDAYPLWLRSYCDDQGAMLSPEDWWSKVSIMFVAFDVEGRFEFMLYGGDGPLEGMKFVVGGTISTGVEYATD